MDDVTTLFVGYVDGLRDTLDAEVMDSTTLVAKDQPTIRLSDLTDVNTAYQVALSA
jgi:hypothetical protein